MKDITMGQFQKGNTWLHKMDVRSKLYFWLVFTILCFVSRNWTSLLLCLITVCLIFLTGRVKPSVLMRQRPAILLLLVFSLLNLFSAAGNVIWQMGPFVVTDAGVQKMAFLFLRLFLIMETAAVIGYTTQPAELLEGLCKAFHIGNEHAMSILLALGFLPQMSREMNRIRMAQAARGADIRAGSIGKRLKNSMAVVIPLFRLTFERADQMADALDVRCYGAEEERTTRSPLKYGIRDGVCLLYTIFLISGVVITGWIL